jgi:L-alanine-DL-glutamate epimerase-like enolase superfamily enzyme
MTAPPSTRIATQRIELVPPQVTPGGTFSAVWAVDVDVQVGESIGRGRGRAFTDDQAQGIAHELDRLGADDRVQAAMADSHDARGRLGRWRQTWLTLEAEATPGSRFLALAALDEAMWDLPRTTARPSDGPAKGAPLASPSIGTYWSGLWLHSTIDELVNETRWATEQRFGGAKLRVDGAAVGASIDRARAMLGAAPPGRWLALEFAGSGTPDTVAEIVGALDASRLLWVEDPLPAVQLAETAALVRRLAVPIAAGEDCWGRAALAERVAATRIGMPIVDLGLLGGPSAMLAILEDGAYGRTELGVHIDALVGADVAVLAPRVAHVWLEAFAWWGAPSVDEIAERTLRTATA